MMEYDKRPVGSFYEMFPKEGFGRLDETDDAEFYARDRFVEHLDSLALATVEKLVGELIVEEAPVILDLMAGWDSHIPAKLRPAEVVGLGLNPRELGRNQALSKRIIQDLNREPSLPFPDGYFDAVLNTVSVDYMTRPLEVFREVGRVLKPGGLFLVIFSNRMFPQKAVKLWRQASEEERVIYVQALFEHAESFDPVRVFISKGRPRPPGDPYSHLGIPSDPVYAVYAERSGGDPGRKPRPWPPIREATWENPEELQRRMAEVAKSLRCPYCGERMLKWAVPQNPFTEWDVEFMYICFNDSCPYLMRGWGVMGEQGNVGMSYRCMYNPANRRCIPVPVPSLQALKDGIVD